MTWAYQLVTTYNLMGIPSGRDGVRRTLELMATIARSGSVNPTVFEITRKVIAKVPEKDWRGEAAAILHFVQNAIRYTKDIDGVETLQTPAQTLRIKQGDCDDKSILAAAMLLTVGHPVLFKAVGKSPGTFCHVYPETKIGNKWVALETTEKWPLGKYPSGIKSVMIHHIKRPTI